MTTSMVTVLAGMLSFASSAWGQSGVSPPPLLAKPAPVSPALAEAAANQARAKTQPVLLSRPAVPLPDSEKALGHHGRAGVMGIVGVDGRLHEARLVMRTGIAVLDEAALASASAATFIPAKDAAGNSVAVETALVNEFYAYKTNPTGFGLTPYSCRQFILDIDWWRSVRGEGSVKSHDIYQTMAMMSRFSLASKGGALRATDVEASDADFERRWNRAVETCRKSPDREWLDTLQPEGQLVKEGAAKLNKAR